MQEYLLLIVAAILVNNILLARFLGNCPFLGVSRKMDTAVGMSFAVIFVCTLAGIMTWAVWQWFLLPFGLGYLRTLVFILVIAALVKFVELVMKKTVPVLYKALGIFLPLITTNCAVLGVAFINVDEEFNFMKTLIFSFASAVGFSLALILMAGLRERFEISPIPKSFQGIAIGLVTAGLMSMAFFGFAGMVK